MSDEWGPWIEHDGKGCPCKGQWVQAEYDKPPRRGVAHGALSGNIWTGRPTGIDHWTWPDPNGNFIRYRIRTPSSEAFKSLEAIAADPKENFRKLVDA